MNMSANDYQEQAFDYQFKGDRRASTDKTPRQRRMQYGRSNRPAVMHNGIHRRRNKRFSW
jgi:hypothetical protein